MNWYKKARIPADRIQKIIERAEKEKQQAIALSQETGDQSVQLSSRDGRRGAMVNRSAKTQGKWQASWFDDRGFYGDSTFDTKEEAMIESFKEGFVIQKDLISEFNKDPKFQKGNEYTRALQIANQFGGSLGFDVLKSYEQGGKESAKNKAQEIRNQQQVKNELV